MRHIAGGSCFWFLGRGLLANVDVAILARDALAHARTGASKLAVRIVRVLDVVVHVVPARMHSSSQRR